MLQCDHNGRRFQRSADNVAFERDLYRVNELTPLDVFYINEFAKQMPKPCPELAQSWLKLFQLPSELAEQHARSGLQPQGVQTEIDKLKNNLEEDMHMRFEREALPVLDALRARDAAPIFDSVLGVTAATFLGFQYLRTPAMMKRVMSLNFDDLPGFNIEASLGVLRCLWATALSASIYKRNDHANVTFLEADGEARFVTSDQPMINLRVAPDGSSREFELYYPLAPDLAMLLSLDADSSTSKRRKLSSEETNRYNARLAGERQSQLYAASVSDLDRLAALGAPDRRS